MASEEIPSDRNFVSVTNSSFYNLSDVAENIELIPKALQFNLKGLRALGGNGTVIGSSDNEILYGNAGDDLLHSEGGNGFPLELRALAGNDTIIGSIDSEIIYGNQGDDILLGGGGNDSILGGKDVDQLEGGLGNDTLIGDFGKDFLWGGLGADLFVLRTDAIEEPQDFFGIPISDSSTVTLAAAPPPQIENSVPIDYIVDFNQTEGDLIGLTNGLTPEDLILSQRIAFPIVPSEYGDINLLSSSKQSSFSVVRQTEVTVIINTLTGDLIGIVANRVPSELRFISLSQDFLKA